MGGNDESGNSILTVAINRFLANVRTKLETICSRELRRLIAVLMIRFLGCILIPRSDTPRTCLPKPSC
jgi:hypothetical protein